MGKDIASGAGERAPVGTGSSGDERRWTITTAFEVVPASERDRLAARVTELEELVKQDAVDNLKLEAENQRLREDLGHRDDALYRIRKISDEYEAHLDRSPESDDQQETT